MARTRSDQPTKVEMQILRVLWSRGEATLREVLDDLARSRRVTPSGIATILKIMVDKGLASVSDERRPQKFVAVRSQADTATSILGDLKQRLFGGSIASLVRSALGNEKITSDQLAELRQLLDQTPVDEIDKSSR